MGMELSPYRVNWEHVKLGMSDEEFKKFKRSKSIKPIRLKQWRDSYRSLFDAMHFMEFAFKNVKGIISRDDVRFFNKVWGGERFNDLALSKECWQHDSISPENCKAILARLECFDLNEINLGFEDVKRDPDFCFPATSAGLCLFIKSWIALYKIVVNKNEGLLLLI